VLRNGLTRSRGDLARNKVLVFRNRDAGGSWTGRTAHVQENIGAAPCGVSNLAGLTVQLPKFTSRTPPPKLASAPTHSSFHAQKKSALPVFYRQKGIGISGQPIGPDTLTSDMSRKTKPKLGQNFLIDHRAPLAIVAALGDLSTRTVLEIGSGHGVLTGLLAARCHRLVAIELDRALAAELTFRFRNHPNVTIHEADVLATDLASLIPPGQTADVIGNLPYYITSDILLKLFATSSRQIPPAQPILHRAVLMMQREVAERVAAHPGTRDFGLLSATAQMNAQVELLFTLPPEAFSPPPDVFSTVLRLHFAPRFTELDVDPTAFNAFLRICFAHKRKTLGNNLRAPGLSPDRLAKLWPASIPTDARAEALPLDSLATLFRSLRDHPAQPVRAAEI